MNGDVRVRIRDSFATAGHDVWVFVRNAGRLSIWRPGAPGERPGAPGEFVSYEDATDPEPSFSLPHGALEALVKEAAGHVELDRDALHEHLEDACAIRDRLLLLIEDGWHS